MCYFFLIISPPKILLICPCPYLLIKCHCLEEVRMKSDIYILNFTDFFLGPAW